VDIVTIFVGVLIFCMGICVFSFLNVVIYRVPRKLDFISGRSMCPTCGHKLGAKDLVPVFSQLFLRGKCRYCKEPISWRYPFVELLGGVAALLCWRQYGFQWRALIVFLFFCVLTAVAFVDADTMEIPDGFVAVVAVIGIVSIPFFPEIAWTSRLLGVFVVSVPMLVLTLVIPGAFGGGDMKLMAACGIFLGWKYSLFALAFAVFTGGVYGIYVLASGKKGRKEHFAFGPFLCMGMVFALFWGDGLWNWYWGLMFQ
jgi:leader peptidase (prepilin peptidase)/N-methyltransferase